MASPPSTSLQQAVRAFQTAIAFTTEPSQKLISDFVALRKSTHEHHVDVLPLLLPASRRLVALSYLRFGPAAKEVERLAWAPWYVSPGGLLDAFVDSVALSQSSLHLLGQWRQLQEQKPEPLTWSTVRVAIRQAQLRRQGSSSKDFAPSDIIEAAKLFNMTLGSKRQSEQPSFQAWKRPRLESQARGGSNPPSGHQPASIAAPEVARSFGNIGAGDGGIHWQTRTNSLLGRAVSVPQIPVDSALRAPHASRLTAIPDSPKPASTAMESAPAPLVSAPSQSSKAVAIKPDPGHEPLPSPPTPGQSSSYSSAPNAQSAITPGTRSTGTPSADLADAPDAHSTAAPGIQYSAACNAPDPVIFAIEKLQDGCHLSDTAIWTVLDVFMPQWIRLIKLSQPLPGDVTWNAWVNCPKFDLLPGESIVCVPVFQPQYEHWVLFHFDLVSNIATLYDSFPSNGEVRSFEDDAQPGCIAEGLTKRLGLDWNAQNWKFVTDTRGGEQDGPVDSAVFVIVYCLVIAARKAIPFLIDAKRWRRLLRSAIAQHAELTIAKPMLDDAISAGVSDSQRILQNQLDDLEAIRDTIATLAMSIPSHIRRLEAEVAALHDAEQHAANLVHCLASLPGLGKATATAALEDVQQNRGQLRDHVYRAESTHSALVELWNVANEQQELVGVRVRKEVAEES